MENGSESPVAGGCNLVKLFNIVSRLLVSGEDELDGNIVVFNRLVKLEDCIFMLTVLFCEFELPVKEVSFSEPSIEILLCLLSVLKSGQIGPAGKLQSLRIVEQYTILLDISKEDLSEQAVVCDDCYSIIMGLK